MNFGQNVKSHSAKNMKVYNAPTTRKYKREDGLFLSVLSVDRSGP